MFNLYTWNNIIIFKNPSFSIFFVLESSVEFKDTFCFLYVIIVCFAENHGKYFLVQNIFLWKSLYGLLLIS